MALILEDGTGKPDAETYVSASEARTYAEKRGVELPAGDQAVEVLLVKAMDWLAALDWAGERTFPEQALDWPRTGVDEPGRPGQSVPPDQVPKRIKDAQSRLAMEAVSLDLAPSSDGRAVKKEKVADLEVEYADPVAPAVFPILPAVDALVDGYLVSSGGGGGQLTVSRG